MTELLRFYEDLGIIANRGSGLENNDNLLQGQQFMEHRRYNKRHVKPNMIEGLANMTPINKPSFTTYNDVFKDFDKNNDGDISKDESQKWFKLNQNRDIPNVFFENEDKNKDNALDYFEFVSAVNKVPSMPAPVAPSSAPVAPSVSVSAPAQAPYVNDDLNGINLDATTFQPINSGSSKTIEGRKNNSILETRSIKYHYIAWIFFAVFVIWAIFNISAFSLSGINIGSEFQPAQNESNAFSMIIMVILIVVVIIVFGQFNSSQVKTTVSVYDSNNNDKNDKNGNGKDNSKKDTNKK
jgi:hypothetical protein